MRKAELVGFLIILVSIAPLLVQCITGYPANINLIVPAILFVLGFVVFIAGRFMRQEKGRYSVVKAHGRVRDFD